LPDELVDALSRLQPEIEVEARGVVGVVAKPVEDGVLRHLVEAVEMDVGEEPFGVNSEGE
jgi:hypothetical protein